MVREAFIAPAMMTLPEDAADVAKASGLPPLGSSPLLPAERTTRMPESAARAMAALTMLLGSGPPSEMLITLAPLARARSIASGDVGIAVRAAVVGIAIARIGRVERHDGRSEGDPQGSAAVARRRRHRGHRRAVALRVGDPAVGGDVAAGRIDLAGELGEVRIDAPYRRPRSSRPARSRRPCRRLIAPCAAGPVRPAIFGVVEVGPGRSRRRRRRRGRGRRRRRGRGCRGRCRDRRRTAAAAAAAAAAAGKDERGRAGGHQQRVSSEPGVHPDLPAKHFRILGFSDPILTRQCFQFAEARSPPMRTSMLPAPLAVDRLLDLRPRQQPLSGLGQSVRADRRPNGRVYRGTGSAARMAEARIVQKGILPRSRHDARRPDEGAWRRAARLPRLCPRHRHGAAHRRPAGGRGARPAAGPQVRLHQRRRGLCSARARPARPRQRLRRPSTTSTPWTMSPSPTRAPTRRCASASPSTPERALFAEDMARNLVPAKKLGMTTVWVDNGSEQASHDADPAFIDYRIADIGDWLERDHGREGHDRGAEPDDRGGVGAARFARPATRPSSSRRSRPRSSCSIPARLGSPRRGRKRLAGQPVAEEGRPPLLPPQPDGGDRRRPGRRPLVGQGAVQVRRLGRRTASPAPASAPSRARSSAAAPSSARARC